MLLADRGDGIRVQAAPGRAGWCPMCREPLLGKCGQIVTWHWAHHARLDCDPWSEPESAWHAAWKWHFAPEQTEVTVGSHRADIVAGDTVIELQHGSLPVDEIRERERFYRAEVGALVWVFDATAFIENVSLRRRQKIGLVQLSPGVSYFGSVDDDRGDPRYRTFRWRWPRKSHGACTAPLYWDLGDGVMFRVHKLHSECPLGGWGRLGTQAEFLMYYIPPVPSAGPRGASGP